VQPFGRGILRLARVYLSARRLSQPLLSFPAVFAGSLLTYSLPYFGQRNWFVFLHPVPYPDVQERYAKEIRRVIGVIDGHLERTGRQWLVGEKMCFADLMFVPWNWQALKISMGTGFAKEWEET
jgi:glutathione S-transferase